MMGWRGEGRWQRRARHATGAAPKRPRSRASASGRGSRIEGSGAERAKCGSPVVSMASGRAG